jgi:uncharacterized protein YggE
MLRRVFCALLVGVAIGWFVELACGEDGSGGTISASGKARLQVKPNKLRVQVELRCYGGTVEAALKSLKMRREAAGAQLKKLKADATSISFSIPRAGAPQATAPGSVVGYSVVSPAYAAPSSYAAAVPPPTVYAPPAATPLAPPPIATDPAPAVEPAEPSPTPPRAVPVKPRPSLFVATTTLRAEWLLQGDDADAVIAAAEAIRQKVTAVDLTGGKLVHDKLSPEEQELAEEVEMRTARPVDPSASSPFLPEAKPQLAFVYVAVLSDKQRKAMLAEACAAARRDAAELAEAAGMKLGSIASLQCNFSNSRGVYFSNSRGVFTTAGPDYASSPLTSHDDHETVAATPDGLEFDCYVSMSHRVLPAGGKP